jgi:hypothetical protein
LGLSIAVAPADAPTLPEPTAATNKKATQRILNNRAIPQFSAATPQLLKDIPLSEGHPSRVAAPDWTDPDLPSWILDGRPDGMN